MKNVEVEFKHSLPNRAGFMRRLADLGATPLGEIRQVDTYFNAPHKDFLAGEVVSEWLRLRHETSDGDRGERASINFKRWHPVGAVKSTHCDEYETQVGDIHTLRTLLEALDFTEMVTVDKTRRRLRLDDAVIAIDSVAGLGSFVEFEYEGNAASVEEATVALRAVINKIGGELGERDRRGYPYLLLNRAR